MDWRPKVTEEEKELPSDEGESEQPDEPVIEAPYEDPKTDEPEE